MRLAVFVDQIFWFDGERYSTDEAFIKFIASFSIYFEEIIIIARVSDERKVEKYVINDQKIRICALPFYKDIYTLCKYGFIFFPKIYNIFSQNISKWDFIWIGAPHFITLLLSCLAKKHSKPFFLLVRQNLIEQVRHRNKGIRKMFGMATVSIIEYFCQLQARHSPIFTVGCEMTHKYKKINKNVFEVAISLISQQDIVTVKEPHDTKKKGIKLLSVGRLDPEKGLKFLIAAIKDLRREGSPNVVLNFVGSGLEEDNLKAQVQNLGLTRDIRFLGYISYGPSLLKLYKNSDIFILPSLTGEGLPQVLLEAMAKGLPIIATAVEGIPGIIKNGENGLLIPPANPEAIAEAILYLINDKKLRIKLIKNALEIVKEYTLEKQTHKMTSILQSYLGLELRS